MRVKWTTPEWKNAVKQEELSHRYAEPSKMVLAREAEPAKPAYYRFGHGKEAILVSPAVAAKKAVYEEVPGVEERPARSAVYEFKQFDIDYDVDEQHLQGEEGEKYINRGNPPEKIFVPKDAIYYPPE